MNFSCNSVFTPIRQIVSQDRNRFVDKEYGFNLDLTIVTSKIIAHAYPAIGIEAIYRNPRSEVCRFLESFHKDHYYVYSFCNENSKTYDPNVFRGRAKRYPIADHCCPTLQLMVDFANTAKAWIDKHEDNVCSLHCKAGKGRTGVMLCVLLVRLGASSSARLAIEKYNVTRTVTKNALTRVSQRKYVYFYERLWREVWGVKGDIGEQPIQDLILPPPLPVRVNSIRLININTKSNTSLRLKVYKCLQALQPEYVFDGGISSVSCAGKVVWEGWKTNLVLCPDFMIQIDEVTFTGRSIRLAEFWHNTLFLKKDEQAEGYGWDSINIKHKRAIKLLGKDLRMIFEIE